MTGRGMQAPEGPLQKPYSPCFLTSTSIQPIQEGSALHPGSIPGQGKHLLAHLGLHSMLKANLVPSVLMEPDVIQEPCRCHCAEMVQVPSPEVAEDRAAQSWGILAPPTLL